jgi:hypothetical protein
MNLGRGMSVPAHIYYSYARQPRRLGLTQPGRAIVICRERDAC